MRMRKVRAERARPRGTKQAGRRLRRIEGHQGSFGRPDESQAISRPRWTSVTRKGREFPGDSQQPDTRTGTCELRIFAGIRGFDIGRFGAEEDAASYLVALEPLLHAGAGREESETYETDMGFSISTLNKNINK
eukprot:4895789-Pyramimonas_sp.AAC.1